MAEGEAPPDKFLYERIGNLDIIRFSSDGRAYSKVVTYIPEGNTQYHIVYVLYVDAEHEYDQGELGKFSQQAQQKLERITDLESVDNVDSYLEKYNSLTAEDLDDLLNG